MKSEDLVAKEVARVVISGDLLGEELQAVVEEKVKEMWDSEVVEEVVMELVDLEVKVVEPYLEGRVVGKEERVEEVSEEEMMVKGTKVASLEAEEKVEEMWDLEEAEEDEMELVGLEVKVEEPYLVGRVEVMVPVQTATVVVVEKAEMLGLVMVVVAVVI